MQMRALWTGSISFGLVHIPVRLHNASKDRPLKFRMLAKDSLSPISYQKVRDDHMPISRTDVIKGFEIGKGEYVALSDEDFRLANPRKTQLIDIVSFVEEREIDPKLYEKPYYLEPDKQAAKAYVLLRDALKKSGKVGIARFVLRDREHIGALRAERDIIMLDQLRYADEIRDTSDIQVPARADYSDKELDLALSLIESRTEDFDAREYRDTYTAELKRRIREKSKGRPAAKKARLEDLKPTDIADLLEMLKKSLDQGKHATHSR